MTLRRKYFIWLAVLAAIAVLAVVVFAAQRPRPMYSPPRVKEISGRPVWDMAGTLLKFPITVTLHVIDAQPSGTVDEVIIGSVEFDLRANNGSVVLDGIQHDYREIADALLAAAEREWLQTHPAPLPVTRRSLRAK